MGNKGRYGDGDVQWMRAGKGVLHAEMFATDAEKPTSFLGALPRCVMACVCCAPILKSLAGFQLWLNLPQRLKMSEPGYQMLWKDAIPVVEDDGVRVRTPNSDLRSGATPYCTNTAFIYSQAVVSDLTFSKVKIIAGSYGGKSADVTTYTPLSYLHVTLGAGKSFATAVPKHHNAFLFNFKARICPPFRFVCVVVCVRVRVCVCTMRHRLCVCSRGYLLTKL